MKVYIGKYPKKNKPRKINVQIDPHDTYSMDHTLSLIILPLLIEFKCKNNSYPSNLTAEEWDEILDKMIYSFKQIVNDVDEWSLDVNLESIKILIEKREEGLELFGKYFQDLWW